MKAWTLRLGLLLALVAAGIGGWRAFFPNPERAIRTRLKELAQLASFGPNEAPPAKLWNAQKLGSFFTPEVTIKMDLNGQQPTFSGRDELTSRAMVARQNLSALTVQLSDIVLTLAPDKQSAIAELSARARTGEGDTFGPQELSLRMKKEGGKWLISRVEAVKTLR